ncbi:MAG: putative toxin-antitoxin system toxin component, PIN family [bacterium]
MRIVLDTNIIVSGLLNPYGPPGKIVRMVSSGDLALCYDARIISEYQSVLLRPKFPFDQANVDALLDQIRADGIITAARPLSEQLPDTDDDPFLEVALAGKAKCLVTGNLKHYPEKRRQGMLIVSPTEFLGIYRKEKLQDRVSVSSQYFGGGQ